MCLSKKSNADVMIRYSPTAAAPPILYHHFKAKRSSVKHILPQGCFLLLLSC